MLKKDVFSPEGTSVSVAQELPADHPVSTNSSSSDNEMVVEILAQLKKSEATNKEILKAVKFIKSNYLWRWIFNITRFIFLAMIIVLGIVSWDSIVEFIRTSVDSYVRSSVSSGLDPAVLQNLIKN